MPGTPLGPPSQPLPAVVVRQRKRQRTATVRKRVERFVTLYVSNKLTSELGDGLIRSLSLLKVKRYRREFLDGWRTAWLDIPKKFPDLELAVRIFEVGMRYHMDGDRRVLLDLNSTERLIAEQALGLTT